VSNGAARDLIGRAAGHDTIERGRPVQETQRPRLLRARRTAALIAPLIAFVGVLVGAQPATAALIDPNLLSNGSFEGAAQSPGPTPGWQLRGSAAAAYTGSAEDGSYFADFVPNKVNGSIYQDVPVSASAGQSFQVTIWIRAGVGTVSAIVAVWGNLNGTGSASKAVTAGAGWQRVSVVMAVRGATNAVRVQIYGSPGSHISLDNAVLTYQLLKNNSFEAAGRNGGPTTNWQVLNGGSAAWASSAAPDGKYIGDFVANKPNGSILQDVPVNAGIGQIYQARVWVRTLSTSAILAIWGNANGTGAASVRITPSSTWQQVTVSMALRGRTSTIRVQIYASPGAHVNLDDALLAPVSPSAQTSPAPISTSRYLRDLTGGATDAALMRNRGVVDASNNPSNHAYLQLLDIGGQDQSRGGVLLSATSKFITYAQLVTAVQNYIAGYASRQLPGAPVVIAIGTNNDVDVSAATGRDWADRVVDPLVSFAAQYPGITIAGADDTEPGFSAPVTSSRAWLSGYLGATSARFVFNGSADGCSWTAINGTCNNGWRATDLYWISAGAAPTRIISLPQIYNSTMAVQWGYISRTGAASGSAKVNFGGPLTEYTACSQAGGCGSLGGNAAWSALWSAINSDARTAQSSLPHSTDLRIN
jgi:hypothetical protein